MGYWTKKRIIRELKRIRDYYNIQEEPLSYVIDYIMTHPKAVGPDLYNILEVTDFPELRNHESKSNPT